MSTTNGGKENAPAPAAQAQAPQLSVVAQYIKDLSFENPNAPQSLTQGQQPQISIQINVHAKPLQGNDVEVELKLDGKAQTGTTLMFGFELTYAGVFRIQHVPPEAMNAIVLIECPRLLFPFAREIIAATVATAASRRCFSTRSISSGYTGRRWKKFRPPARLQRPHRNPDPALHASGR